MAVSLGELVFGEQLEELKEKQGRALRNLKRFVTNLEINRETFDPATLTYEIFLEIQELANKVHILTDNIEHFSSIDGTTEYLDNVDNSIEEYVDRFFAWSRRKIVTTREASELLSRSRSTIYRWIKNGKLAAMKVSGRWAIAVSL